MRQIDLPLGKRITRPCVRVQVNPRRSELNAPARPTSQQHNPCPSDTHNTSRKPGSTSLRMPQTPGHPGESPHLPLHAAPQSARTDLPDPPQITLPPAPTPAFPSIPSDRRPAGSFPKHPSNMGPLRCPPPTARQEIRGNQSAGGGREPSVRLVRRNSSDRGAKRPAWRWAPTSSPCTRQE